MGDASNGTRTLYVTYTETNPGTQSAQAYFGDLDQGWTNQVSYRRASNDTVLRLQPNRQLLPSRQTRTVHSVCPMNAHLPMQVLNSCGIVASCYFSCTVRRDYLLS